MEVLISMVIVSFLGGAVYVTFAQGIRVWQAAAKKSQNAQLELFFEQFKSELRNAYQDNGASLNGKNQMIEFVTIQPRMGIKNSGTQALKVPARVRYRFDSVSKVIYKETDFYEKMLHSKSGAALVKPALADVTGLSFEYYRQPEKGTAASWLNKWTGNCFPEAVKISMDSHLVSRMKSVRILPLPAAAGCIEKGKAE